jgi:hypothetical protein|tara:strand:- start:44 stop:256 length:213 start_codon:yes stop_codon:yes gene_type:complete
MSKRKERIHSIIECVSLGAVTTTDATEMLLKLLDVMSSSDLEQIVNDNKTEVLELFTGNELKAYIKELYS